MTFAWTVERVESLKVKWAVGLSASQIANDFKNKLTRNAVLGKVHRLGLPDPEKKAPQSERAPRRSRHRPVPIQAMNTELDRADSGADHKVRFMAAENHHCHWPLWAGDEPIEERFYCGTPTANVLDGHPYCGPHSRMAFDGFGRGARPYHAMRAAE